MEEKSDPVLVKIHPRRIQFFTEDLQTCNIQYNQVKHREKFTSFEYDSNLEIPTQVVEDA